MRLGRQQAQRSLALLVLLAGLFLVPVRAFPAFDHLGDVGSIISSLTDAVMKIPDLVEKTVTTTLSLQDRQKQREVRGELVLLSRDMTQYSNGLRTDVIPALDEYLASPQPDQWEKFKEHLGIAILLLRRLQQRLNIQTSDVVLTEAYKQIDASFRTRAGMAVKWLAMPAPTSKKDIATLRADGAKFDTLAKQLQDAVAKLNEYIKALPE